MNELDETCARMMNEAIAKAHASGRSDVVDYLQLKATNDSVRAAGVKWLFDSMFEIASKLNRNNLQITIENENPHSFASGNATLIGSLVRFRQGVRCLSVEAGWTRTPNDGFMRGGVLAGGRIIHFGIGRHNAELVLVRGKEDVANWFTVDKNGERVLLDSNHLSKHFQIFLNII
jgi:hypothetical protein